MSLECDLGKTSELARMQTFPVLGFELFQRRQADLKMLAYTLPIEFAGHASEGRRPDPMARPLVRRTVSAAVG
jgi:hypothetical protein